MTEFVDKLDVVGRFDGTSTGVLAELAPPRSLGLSGTPLTPRPQVTQASGWPPKYLGSTQYVGRFASTDPPPPPSRAVPACRLVLPRVAP